MIPLDESKELPQNETAKEDAKDAPVDRDLELIIRMGIKMLVDAKGIDVIKQALDSSKDPVQVIGQFLATLSGKLAEVSQQKYGINPALFLAKKGFLEAMLNFIEEKLGLDSSFSDKIYAQVLEIVKGAAQNPHNPPPGAPQAQPPQGATPPQGAMPPQGGPPQGGPVPLDQMGGAQ